jgi:hypothetical protein
VTGLAFRQVGIVEIEITNECTVVKRGGIGSRGAAANHGAFTARLELADLPPDNLNRFTLGRARSASQ